MPTHVAALMLQAYAGSQVLQSIILLCTGTNTGGGYLAPRWLFLVMYIGLTLIWAVLNTFALEVIAFLDVISMWWQVPAVPSHSAATATFGEPFAHGLVANLRCCLMLAGDWWHRHRGDAPAGGQDHAAGVVRVHPFPDGAGGDRDQQQRLRRRPVLPGEPVLPVWVRRGGAPDGGDQGRRQEWSHRHPLQHRHHLRLWVGVHPRAHLQHPGNLERKCVQIAVQPTKIL